MSFETVLGRLKVKVTREGRMIKWGHKFACPGHNSCIYVWISK